MSAVKVYSIGMGQRRQCAMREDGQWFIRGRTQLGRWGSWEECKGRPDGAWYNPARKSSRLALLPPLERLLFCPECKEPHIDTDNKRHMEHVCITCGHEWQPYPYATKGI